MSEIKILHLFADLMSLYGEYGNISILEKTLRDNGHTVTVECTNSLPESLDGYSLIYIGSGTEQDVIEASKRLDGSKSTVEESLASGVQWLVTGTAMALLGTAVTYRDNRYSGVGLFDFTTEMDYQKRWQGDALTTEDNPFGAPVIGYINTSSDYHGIEDGVFTLALGNGMGNQKPSATDGIMIDNLLATQLIGPLLVKNPHLLGWMYHRLTGETLTLDDADDKTVAYNSALSQLKNRI